MSGRTCIGVRVAGDSSWQAVEEVEAFNLQNAKASGLAGLPVVSAFMQFLAGVSAAVQGPPLSK